MMQNTAVHRTSNETSQPRTWMNPPNYHQSLANSMSDPEDSSILTLDLHCFSQPGFDQTQITRNDARIHAIPEWTSQIPDSRQDRGHHWRQIDHNVGIPLDLSTRTQAPSFYWMENGAVNPYSANLHGTVILGSITNEYLTMFENQLDQMSSKPISKPPTKPVDGMRGSTDGRCTQPGHQGTEPETKERRCQWKGCTYTGRFSCESALMRHLKATHVSPKSFDCPHFRCDRAFGRKDKLQEHLRAAHKSTVQHHGSKCSCLDG